MSKPKENKGIHNIDEVKKAIYEVWKLKIDRNVQEMLMNFLIWKVGEAYPWSKYNQKYHSEKARYEKDKKQLHHEHVISRKELKKKLCNAKNEEELNAIIKTITVCVVRRDEHERLNKFKIEGWTKYKEAKIKVYERDEKNKFKVTNFGY